MSLLIAKKVYQFVCIYSATVPMYKIKHLVQVVTSGIFHLVLLLSATFPFKIPPACTSLSAASCKTSVLVPSPVGSSRISNHNRLPAVSRVPVRQYTAVHLTRPFYFPRLISHCGELG